MADQRFHRRAGPWTLDDLARLTGADARPGQRGDLFHDVAAVAEAEAGDVIFVEDRRYLDALGLSAGGACFLHPDVVGRAPAGMALLVTRAPQRAFAIAAAAFHPPDPVAAGISPLAFVDATAEIDHGCEIAAGAHVGAGARIAAGVVIGPNAVVGRGCSIGADSRIGAGASVSHAVIGCRVTLYPGVRIGQDGFGVVPGRDAHVKMPQLGRVIVHDDVEIGANSTIDRGTIGDTIIGPGCFIDNLVQIGHNVRLGRGCIIAALVGISGSTVLGDNVMVGGQVGMSGHIRIGDGCRIAAQSGVMRDLPDGSTVGGTPAIPLPEFLRQSALLRRMTKGKGA
ncbi:UDP-3-O-[3-hydroxymyristoyl] glucosamine N-acyltransferase [Stella humosa]|uniref:UDP-3-O-acylglucosamine N-acyltransferase n=1 Tax=Stella humosa TaxID=94 RepID=A0A3N1M742_9PROT|nr:UDP-3-O-(3-hydroxymyristoyl)glucosamine N-acyltransferase [Stella humosa]ROQ01652.1 UDP-3-O-[3-hydroxymyristoyl] glucosamine N-acyltransferase [Stella humosa]BBK32033.1 UDP-3-O-acylglucosamine N-acyltransferase [Stella humosa]